MPLTVGTAGHIDHGKTWLVRALTGKDTDRLPEEQQRGISIDLGYAPLELPDGRRLSLIDVPGHERFVRNMVAGATGIDLFLLVSTPARARGRRRTSTSRSCGCSGSSAASSRSRRPTPSTPRRSSSRSRRRASSSRRRRSSPSAPRPAQGSTSCAPRSARAADLVAQRHNSTAPARLYVDRVFTLRGIGTVVTGTLWSGSIGEGDELGPSRAGSTSASAACRCTTQPVERAEAGQRVAVALPGVERRELRRGDALVAPGAFARATGSTSRSRSSSRSPTARVHVHHGTRARRASCAWAALRAAPARGAGRGGARRPRRAARGDDGRRRHRARSRARRGTRTPSASSGSSAARRDDPRPRARPTARAQRGRVARRAARRARAARGAAADPLDPGVDRSDRAVGADVLPCFRSSAAAPSSTSPDGCRRSATARPTAAALEAELADAEPAAVEGRGRELARFLESEGRLVRLGDGYAVSRATYERARALVVEECERAGRISLARFRDLAGCGRRDAQLLLERLDADGVTRRVRDERLLRRRPSEPAT